ncbi:MAG: hypothetical protein ETSY2_44740 [Candidatus Entotheonella gemina]|uniref:Uncharacterized protein n=1 Tax=Candidatus Entotheonella gemina TaxID=1429439 RepID=W4LJ67_9BACT|nr:MAG: hypothetical protein ETSY2_44740 [Candidatus Entotheonella gemina]
MRAQEGKFELGTILEMVSGIFDYIGKFQLLHSSTTGSRIKREVNSRRIILTYILWLIGMRIGKHTVASMVGQDALMNVLPIINTFSVPVSLGLVAPNVVWRFACCQQAVYSLIKVQQFSLSKITRKHC